MDSFSRYQQALSTIAQMKAINTSLLEDDNLEDLAEAQRSQELTGAVAPISGLVGSLMIEKAFKSRGAKGVKGVKGVKGAKGVKTLKGIKVLPRTTAKADLSLSGAVKEFRESTKGVEKPVKKPAVRRGALKRSSQIVRQKGGDVDRIQRTGGKLEKVKPTTRQGIRGVEQSVRKTGVEQSVKRTATKPTTTTREALKTSRRPTSFKAPVRTSGASGEGFQQPSQILKHLETDPEGATIGKQVAKKSTSVKPSVKRSIKTPARIPESIEMRNLGPEARAQQAISRATTQATKPQSMISRLTSSFRSTARAPINIELGNLASGAQRTLSQGRTLSPGYRILADISGARQPGATALQQGARTATRLGNTALEQGSRLATQITTRAQLPEQVASIAQKAVSSVSQGSGRTVANVAGRIAGKQLAQQAGRQIANTAGRQVATEAGEAIAGRVGSRVGTKVGEKLGGALARRVGLRLGGEIAKRVGIGIGSRVAGLAAATAGVAGVPMLGPILSGILGIATLFSGFIGLFKKHHHSTQPTQPLPNISSQFGVN